MHKENDELINDNELKTAQVGLLTEQVEYLKNCGDNFLADCEMLQKQVDELTEERENMQAEIIATEEARLQAVKSTAKEIYSEIGDDDILVISTQEYGKIEVVPLERLQEIVKGKGVEVE